MRVAVVGAGIHGLSATRQLAERGHQVTLFEQFVLGHEEGSSHGASRIVRKAYPDAFYTEHMLRAYPMWAELDHAAGGGILHECGLLYYGSEDSPSVISMAEGLLELKVDHQVYPSGDVHKVMQGLKLNEGEVGIFTPEGGWVNAALALKSTWKLAHKAGAKLREQRIEDITSLEKGFDAVVLCPGAWIKMFADVPVRVSLQTYAYLERRNGGPVWIEDSPDGIYGFPSEPGSTRVKIGVHSHGAETDPDLDGRQTSPHDLDKIRTLAHRRFGEHAARLTNDKGCLYTSTPNEDFLLGRLGSKTYFASACSGHGFKFGPYIGKLMADFVEGKDEPENHPRWLYDPEA